MGSVNQSTIDSLKHVLEDLDLTDMKVKVDQLYEDGKERLQPVDSWLKAMVTERPLVAIGAVFGIGYVIGRLIRRV